MKKKAAAIHGRTPLGLFKPFLLAFWGVAFLLLFASPAYAQNGGHDNTLQTENKLTTCDRKSEEIYLCDILDALALYIKDFEICHGTGHLFYDLIKEHERKAKTYAELVWIYPLATSLNSTIGHINDLKDILLALLTGGKLSALKAIGVAAYLQYISNLIPPPPDLPPNTRRALVESSLVQARQALELLARHPCALPSMNRPTYPELTAAVDRMLSAMAGDYTGNDGGAPGEHLFHWLRSDDADKTENLTLLATTKDYTPVGADFGKYVWVQTTPVGSNGLAGVPVPGEAIQVGMLLSISVEGAGGGTNPLVDGNPAEEGVLIYGPVLVSLSPTDPSSTVLWTATPNEGTFGDATAASTTYVPAAAPSAGKIVLTATLSSAGTEGGKPQEVGGERGEADKADSPGDGCHTAGGPLGLIALGAGAFMYMRRK